MTTTAAPNKQRVRRYGIVDRAVADRTRRVVIEYQTRHPKYGKYIRRRTTLQVHDQNNESGLGDRVEIIPCRPVSKTKRWKLVRVVERAVGATPHADVTPPEAAEAGGEQYTPAESDAAPEES